MANLNGKVVMITGASSGFGAVTARVLADSGARLVLGARREDRLQSLVKELGGEKVAICKATDVTRAEDLKNLCKAGIDAFGRIDSLINNAGVAPVAPLLQSDISDWDKMIDVNVKGVLYSIHAVLPHMMERGSGQVVNICSLAGHRVSPGFTVYSATKYAVKAISEGLALETGGKIQVTNLSPGLFETEILSQVEDGPFRDQLNEFLPEAQSPEHVANAILFALQQDPKVRITELTIEPTA